MTKVASDKKVFARFLIAGVYNTVVGYAGFSAIYYSLIDHLHYLIVLTFSNIFAITNSYFFYKFFVFRTKGNYLREYLKCFSVYGFSIALNYILFPILAYKFMPYFLKQISYEKYTNLSPYLAQLTVIAVLNIISFYAHKNYSFKPKDRIYNN